MAESESNEPEQQPLSVPTGPLEIHPTCWMVGNRNPASLLQCNTYIRSFENGSSPINVCVDPGSQLDFPVIKENITQLVGGLEAIHSCSLNHQDPDVIGNTGYLFEANPDINIMVTEEVWRLAQHMLYEPHHVTFANPVQSQMTVIGEKHRWQLVPTPFCHFRGAMAFYDPEIHTLFTGDLFGGLNQLGRVHLVAEERDWDGIAQFHQIYMPTREALRYAVRQIRALKPPVQVIAPQHGYVITGSLVPLFLERMHELLVGQDLFAVELDETYLQAYGEVIEQLLARARSLLGRNEVEQRLAMPLGDGLEQLVRFDGRRIHVDREGYSAVAKVAARLASGLSLEFTNILRSDILTSCTKRNLPIPPIGAGLAEGVTPAATPPADIVSPPPGAGGLYKRHRKRRRKKF